jgi:pyroglutamyl-peptidase
MLVVTGFLPFGTDPRNPSGEIAARRAATGEAGVTTVVLPVARSHAFDLAREVIARTRPRAVIALGLGAMRTGIDVERFARNVEDYRRPDVAGEQPRGAILMPGGAERLATSLPVDGLASAIRGSGVAAGISEDAGSYVCNHLYYRLLHLGLEQGFSTVFLHLPPLPECVAGNDGRTPMPLATAEHGIRAALRMIAAL